MNVRERDISTETRSPTVNPYGPKYWIPSLLRVSIFAGTEEYWAEERSAVNASSSPIMCSGLERQSNHCASR